MTTRCYAERAAVELVLARAASEREKARVWRDARRRKNAWCIFGLLVALAAGATESMDSVIALVLRVAS